MQIVKKVVNYRRLCDFHNSAWKKSVEKKQELEIKSKDAKTETTSNQIRLTINDGKSDKRAYRKSMSSIGDTRNDLRRLWSDIF